MRIGLNVGSGQRPFASNDEIEWVNIDKVEREGMKVDRVDDGCSLCTADASVDIVVLHHVLEHLWPDDAKLLIMEAFRVLKPSGSLLVFVPNMQALAARWLGGELTTQVYLTNVYGAYMGNDEDRHKWGFDALALSDFLWSSAQWTSMKPFDWRDVPGADFARDWWVLAAEVIK